jgi:hypothetical protein
MARRYTRHFVLSYFEQRARDEGILSDEEIADRRTQAAVERLLREATDATELYHSDAMRGCGELVAALGRFLRDLPVKFHEDEDPRTVVSALMSAIRDTAAGTDPELFKIVKGRGRPVTSTAVWKGRAYVVACMEALIRYAGMTDKDAASKIADKTINTELDIEKLLADARGSTTIERMNRLPLDWREEIADRANERPPLKNYPLETVNSIVGAPPIPTGENLAGAETQIISWLRKRLQHLRPELKE